MCMRVNLIEIPKETLINNRFAKLDFEECLSLNFEINKTLDVDDVMFKSFEKVLMYGKTNTWKYSMILDKKTI